MNSQEALKEAVRILRDLGDLGPRPQDDPHTPFFDTKDIWTVWDLAKEAQEWIKKYCREDSDVD